MKAVNASDGMSVYDHTHQSAMLIVFLRFIGCSFCESTVKSLIPYRRSLEQNGIRLMFVHMGNPEEGEKMMADYGVANPLHVSNPEQELYNAFELQRCFFKQYTSARVWYNAARLYFTKGIKVGKAIGDRQQMPGVFLVHNGKIENAYHYDYISDEPDFLALADCELCTEEPAPLMGH